MRTTTVAVPLLWKFVFKLNGEEYSVVASEEGDAKVELAKASGIASPSCSRSYILKRLSSLKPELLSRELYGGPPLKVF